MKSLPVQTIVLALLLIALIFAITGIGYSFDANGWNALATFFAVIVALSFGLREMVVANNARRSRELIAIALIIPPLIRVKNELKSSLEALDEAIRSGARIPWEGMEFATTAVADALKEHQNFRPDLPEPIAVAVSLCEAGCASSIPLLKGIELRNGGYASIPHPLPADLAVATGKIQHLLRIIYDDLRLAHALGLPYLQAYRPKLERHRAQVKNWDFGVSKADRAKSAPLDESERGVE